MTNVNLASRENGTGLPETSCFLDVIDDLSCCRDMVELILMAHRYAPAGDTEAKAISTTAYQVIQRMDKAMEQLNALTAKGGNHA